MVYLFAVIGFIFGFSVGLGSINVALRYKTKEEIQSDKSLRWKYGILVWVFAFIGGWLGITIYNNYFY
jgi:hypothetical protein